MDISTTAFFTSKVELPSFMIRLILRRMLRETLVSPPQFASLGFTKVGWTVGAGVEHAITPAWSVKFEYDYIGLGGETIATPEGLVQPIPGATAFNLTPAGNTRVSQNFQEATLGLNYKFGVNPSARWDLAASTSPVKASVIVVAPGWELEAGARAWFSSGTFQKDVGNTLNPHFSKRSRIETNLCDAGLLG